MDFYALFPKILNMSLTASVAIAFVLLLRLLLKKAPKVISYALWGVVLFRLLCPVSIESEFSLFGLLETPTVDSSGRTSMVEYIPSNIVHTENPEVVLPVPGIGEAITEALPQGEEQLRADPLEGPVFIATYVWWGGILVMAVYGIVTYLRLRRRLITASPLRDNIYLADEIESPFVMGLIRPKIYLPSEMEEWEQSYIILHEQHHIRRLDHIVKALSFVALCIHWFNPLVWVAFIHSGKDMEMSCDESVVRKLGTEIRADYTASLLSLATGKRIIAGMPLAFGEGNTKGRIKNLANWKKPEFWVVLVSVVVCIVLAVCLLTNPKQDTYSLRIVVPAGSTEEIIYQEDFSYSDEEISPKGNQITISLGEGIGDTEVVLKPIEVKEENAYEPTYITPGMPVKMDVEKGAWFKIGINMQNPTDEDIVVYVEVEGVEVRIEDGVGSAMAVNHSYGVVEVTYESPLTSFSMVAQQNTPEYMLDENYHLFSVNEYSEAPDWTDLGELSEITITKENFDELFRNNSGEGWFSRESASAIRRNTVKAWSVIYDQEKLYYILQQENGELYLAYGYYDYSEKDDPGSDDTYIRWLYKLAPQDMTASSSVTKWFDYTDNPSSMGDELNTELPDFPGVTFTYNGGQIIASKPFDDSELTGYVILIGGMPIWNAYFTDLTGDGYPEICATYSLGSGIIDTRIVVCDYVNGASYELSDRGYHDFYLRMNEDDGYLYVEKRIYPNGELVSSGRLVYKDECIQIDPELNYVYSSLQDKYPEYYGLDASNGLDVYVWQMAESSYSFSLLPHTETQRDWISDELMNLRGTDANEMRSILASYGLEESDIHIIPWQNLYSSYIADIWIVEDGISQEDKQEKYIEQIYNMLFPSEEVAAPVETEPTESPIDYGQTISRPEMAFPGLEADGVKIDENWIEVPHDGAILEFHMTYNSPAIILEFGLIRDDGFEIKATVEDGVGIDTLENIPAGRYQLFVRNIGYVNDLPGKTVEGGAVNCTLYGGTTDDMPLDPDKTFVDLTKGELKIKAEDIANYIFYTNSTKIAIKVSGPNTSFGVVMLHSVESGDDFIQTYDLEEENDCVFQNLTAATYYMISVENLSGCELTVSEDTSFLDKLFG